MHFSPHPIELGHTALMAIVCLSVCPVPDPKSSMEGSNKLKIGKKEAHDTSDLCNPFRDRKVKGQGNKITSQNGFSFEVRLELVAPVDE